MPISGRIIENLVTLRNCSPEFINKSIDNKVNFFPDTQNELSQTNRHLNPIFGEIRNNSYHLFSSSEES